MAWDPLRQAELSAAASLSTVRKLKLEATQRLLGNTIILSEQAWQEPARLPGWTRAHVATHLARNAEALVRSVDSVLMGRRGLMYDSDTERDLAIERGSERSGLDLQVDLDTSAGHLNRRFNVLDAVPNDMLVELRPGLLLPATMLPMVRLNEVVLHHIDLDCGFEVVNIDPEVAHLLLRWNTLDVDAYRETSVRLISDSGVDRQLGPVTDGQLLRGSDAVLLGWLTGRLSPELALELPKSPVRG